MYSFFSGISSYLSEPFLAASRSDVALIAALFLGFIGSVAPCQLSANVAVITYFGKKQAQGRMSGAEVLLYITGKIVLFSLLGCLFWLLGNPVSRELIPLFEYARKLQGPLLVLIGLFMLGLFRLPFGLGTRFTASLEQAARRAGARTGAFLMGMAFSLGFCPTMFVLFFGMLMPMAVQSAYGAVLPSVFAAGTAMPFLLFLALTVGFGADRMLMRKAKRWGGIVQKLAGLLFLLLGISDTMTYWAD
ncbi:sulfite exporter TauE/SafE family protein [Paenibacillus sp. FJAT-26967]|uniref:urease accessory protein UreH domain-containing protein n=1 Tax=Paenibacillus sp. FJAT-26967 TaxID=1729690 RepID=UPI0008381BAE|nr:sulfite exporter TauE/SafE family protein [Paenibacillus sp. FJAT-26967]